MKLVIDDGTRAIPVENQYGQPICTIHIRPADISILDRYTAMRDGLTEMLKPLEGIGLNADGTAEFEKDWEKLKAVEAAFIERLNNLLDTTESARIFENRNPFSAVGGRFFCENVLDAMGDLIAKAIEDEAAQTQKRIAKYLPEGSDDAGQPAETT